MVQYCMTRTDLHPDRLGLGVWFGFNELVNNCVKYSGTLGSTIQLMQPQRREDGYVLQL